MKIDQEKSTSGKSPRWKSEPGGLFDRIETKYEREWVDMPAYEHADLEPIRSITVHFYNRDDIRDFASKNGVKITDKTKSVNVGAKNMPYMSTLRWISTNAAPRYPIYVISKGRWESRHTHKALMRMGVPHRLVIEPTEFEQYAAVIDPSMLLVLPFHDLGQGSIPARNWVWDHAVAEGHEKHWILDDNISGFFRFHRNYLVHTDSICFRTLEEFVSRYDNVLISGLQYFMFVPRKSNSTPPFSLNTRVYSCILIDHRCKHRWRGRYNEDTDLSLRVLKDGDCTVLLNSFVCEKLQTLTCKGGNTATVYAEDNARWKMAEHLRAQHPDVATITQKWGRAQHHVDYRPFAGNRLIRNDKSAVNLGAELRLLVKQPDGSFSDTIPDEWKHAL